MQLTEEAQLNKPKLQRWLDEFGENYSKVVVVLSVAVALIGPLLFKWPFICTPGNLCYVLHFNVSILRKLFQFRTKLRLLCISKLDQPIFFPS